MYSRQDLKCKNRKADRSLVLTEQNSWYHCWLRFERQVSWSMRDKKTGPSSLLYIPVEPATLCPTVVIWASSKQTQHFPGSTPCPSFSSRQQNPNIGRVNHAEKQNKGCCGGRHHPKLRLILIVFVKRPNRKSNTIDAGRGSP